MDEKVIVVITEGSVEKPSDDRQSSTEEKEEKGSLHAKSFDKISIPMFCFSSCEYYNCNEICFIFQE